MNPAEHVFPERREFVVGEQWAFQVPITRYQLDAPGATISSPTAVVIRVSDGVDVTTSFWPSGTGSVTPTHAQWSAFAFAAAGDYEIRLSVLVNGNKRTDVLRARVYQ